MPELQGIDCRAERDLLRKASELEAKVRNTIEHRRRVVAEQSAELEAKVAASERELHAEQMATDTLQREVASRQREGRKESKCIAGLWPEAEEAAGAANRVNEQVSAVRAQQQRLHEKERAELETQQCVYEILAGATGVCWDTESRGVEGYVAIGNAVRHIDTTGMPRKAAADKMWEQIEGCLAENDIEEKET